MKIKTLITLIGIASLGLLISCDKNDVEDVADDTKEALHEAGQEIEDAADKTAEEVKDAAEETGDEIEKATD